MSTMLAMLALFLFILDCDASRVAIGCALSQVRDGKEVPIAFASYSLIPAQRKYCTSRKELLVVVRFTGLFRQYLLGRRFMVRTDHNSLSWLFSFSYVKGQLARWQEELERMWIRFVLIIILVFLLRVFLVLRMVRIVTSVKKADEQWSHSIGALYSSIIGSANFSRRSPRCFS